MQKTRYLVVGDKAKSLQINMGAIKIAESFKYLGAQITSDARRHDEIHSRMDQARATSRQPNGSL